MLNRRRFLQSIIAAAAAPSALRADVPTVDRPVRGGGLVSDRRRRLDLAESLEYQVISRKGARMSDGFRVPGSHDGMAAFPGADGRVILVRNHELDYKLLHDSALGERYPEIPYRQRGKFYDRGGKKTPGAGGTTTTVYHPAQRKVEKQFLSLAGTEFNCAGGPTPWGSWLSCEECFENVGTQKPYGIRFVREKNHGYVFEVPATATGLVEPIPLKDMGRFEHEACAVHEPTGIVYMTEDRYHSLFYRFIPNVPGELVKGGKLQALALVGLRSFMTHNWGSVDTMPEREPLQTRWIDLNNVDPIKNDLRLRGAARGAATFARGEGLCAAGDRFAFTCTIGGSARLGQVFTYKPSPYEGTPREKEVPGELELIAEAARDSLLHNADNLTQAPWGDLVLCEDTGDNCGLVGIRPDGSQYTIAFNAYSDSELAGVCFSPDGQVMFLNIQYPGMTVAITGDFAALASS
jgi:secreted PhoX family phosphatase